MKIAGFTPSVGLGSDLMTATDSGAGPLSSLRVLFLTQVLPYPPDAGPRIKTWNVLRALDAAGCRITLVSYVRDEETRHIPAVRSVCEEVVTVPMHRSRIKDVIHLVRGLLQSRPFLLVRDDLPAMRRAVDRLVKTGRYSVIHADQVTMTQFALPSSHIYRIFDAHNATWKILGRARRTNPWWMRPLLALEERRMRTYEGMVVSSFERTLSVTEQDRTSLQLAVQSTGSDLAEVGDRVISIPISIDTDRLTRLNRQPDPDEILTLGSLNYAPNAEGIRWFAERVFPHVRRQRPTARLKVIGKNPPADLVRMARRSQGAIQVLGYVEDLEPYFRSASVFVVPVLSGSGMRVRILEALARGVPMVTTPVGLEGVDAEDGEEVLVADGEEDFASAVVRLAGDTDLQQRLAVNGRRLAVRLYDWRRALAPMVSDYGSMVAREKDRAAAAGWKS